MRWATRRRIRAVMIVVWLLAVAGILYFKVFGARRRTVGYLGGGGMIGASVVTPAPANLSLA